MKKFIISISVIFALYLVAGFFLLPKIAKTQIENLAKNEFDLNLSIEKIYINPLNFKLNIDEIKLKNKEDKILEFSSIKTKFKPLSLKDKLISFEFLNINKPNIYLKKKNEILNLPKLKENNNSSQSKFGFEIINFNINNGKFIFSDYDLEKERNITLTDINYTIKNINTQKNSIGNHKFNAKSNLLKNINFNSSLNTNPIALNGNLELKSLSLKPVFAYLLKEIKTKNIIADIKMPFSIRFENGKFHFQTDKTNLYLKNLDLSIKEKPLVAENIDFNNINLSTNLTSLKLDLDELSLKNFKFNNANFKSLDINKSKLFLDDFDELKPKFSFENAVLNEANYNEKLNFNLQNARLENLDFSLKPFNLNLIKLDTNELNATQNEYQILNIYNANISDINLNDKNLTLENAFIKNSSVLLGLLEDNSLDILNIYKTNTNSSENNEFFYNINSFEVANLDVFLKDIKRNSNHKFNLNFNANNINPSDDFNSSLNLNLNSANIKLNSTANLARNYINSNYTITNLNLKNYQNYINEFINIIIKNSNIKSNGNFKLNDEKIELNSNLQIKNLELENMKNQNLILAKEIFLPQIKLKNENLEINNINIENLKANLSINEQNQTNFSQIIKTNNDKKELNLNLNLNEITLKDSLLNYENLGSKQKLNISKINANLQKQKNKSSILNLKAIINENAVLNANSDLNIKNIKEKTKFEISIKNLILSKLNPTIAPNLGKNIENGTLSALLKYEINKSKLTGENLLDIRNLTFGKYEDNASALPIEAFVAILSDSDNKMQLSLPVSGDLDEPSFSYSGIIFQAFANLVTQSVLSPFSIVGKLLNIDTKGLESIDFEAGKSIIEVSELEKIKHYESILAQKPNLKLSIKGTFEPKLDLNAMKNEALMNDLQKMSEKSDILKLYEMKFNKQIEDKNQAKIELLQSYKIDQKALENLAYARANAIKEELLKKAVKPSQIEIANIASTSSQMWISSKITLK